MKATFLGSSHEHSAYVEAVLDNGDQERSHEDRCARGSELAYLHRAQIAVSTITMAVSDHFLGSAADTDCTAELWCELNVRYSVSAESTVNALLTYYNLV